MKPFVELNFFYFIFELQKKIFSTQRVNELLAECTKKDSTGKKGFAVNFLALKINDLQVAK